ncbi:hypothetical protein EDS67_21325 [candidate division KSB1 bacterium]|nr:MAG: hypothetical protein EDS67_21325 [candidate division KSB1 bacterium]
MLGTLVVIVGYYTFVMIVRSPALVAARLAAVEPALAADQLSAEYCIFYSRSKIRNFSHTPASI